MAMTKTQIAEYQINKTKEQYEGVEKSVDMHFEELDKKLSKLKELYHRKDMALAGNISKVASSMASQLASLNTKLTEEKELRRAIYQLNEMAHLISED